MIGHVKRMGKRCEGGRGWEASKDEGDVSGCFTSAHTSWRARAPRLPRPRRRHTSPRALPAALPPILPLQNYGVELGAQMCRRLLDFGVPGLHMYSLNLDKTVLAILERMGIIDTSSVSCAPACRPPLGSSDSSGRRRQGARWACLQHVVCRSARPRDAQRAELWLRSRSCRSCILGMARHASPLRRAAGCPR